MPLHHTSQPSPQAPKVGLSQSSSTNRISCSAISIPIASSEPRYNACSSGGAGLYQNLILIIMLQPVWVFPIAAISGPPRRLHIGRCPRPCAQRAQRGRWVKRARTHFHIIRLHNGAALRCPIGLQSKYNILKTTRRRLGHGFVSLSLSYAPALPRQSHDRGQQTNGTWRPGR